MDFRNVLWIVIASIAILACNRDDGPAQQPDPDPIGEPEPEQENQAPNGFSILSPEADEKDVHRAPTFTWEEAIDPESDKVTYDFYFGKSPDSLELLAEKLEDTSFSMQEHLDFETTYYWRVMATDENNNSVASDTASFVTDVKVIAFLSRFLKVKEDDSDEVVFVYENEKIGSLIKDGFQYTLHYDDDPIKRPTLAVGNTTNHQLRYTYTYSLTGEQDKISYRSVPTDFSSRNWNIDRLDQNTMKVMFNSSNLAFYSEVKSTITFSENVDQPIHIETLDLNPIKPQATRASISWEGNNISEIVIDRLNENNENYEFSQRVRYTYDNNPNPYYNIIVEKFGWDDIFISHQNTGLESISLYQFYWQSQNNIVKIEIFNAEQGDPDKVIMFNYSYNDDYYPNTATVNITSNGESSTETWNWNYEIE